MPFGSFLWKISGFILTFDKESTIRMVKKGKIEKKKILLSFLNADVEMSFK